jgi:hypothetical protein
MTDDESLLRLFFKKPGSFTTAILSRLSDFTAMNVEPIIKITRMIGNKNVESKNVLFLTRVKYSRLNIIAILFISYF